VFVCVRVGVCTNSGARPIKRKEKCVCVCV